jgi:hypothetical protein
MTSGDYDIIRLAEMRAQRDRWYRNWKWTFAAVMVLATALLVCLFDLCVR